MGSRTLCSRVVFGSVYRLYRSEGHTLVICTYKYIIVHITQPTEGGSYPCGREQPTTTRKRRLLICYAYIRVFESARQGMVDVRCVLLQQAENRENKGWPHCFGRCAAAHFSSTSTATNTSKDNAYNPNQSTHPTHTHLTYRDTHLLRTEPDAEARCC